MKGQKYPSEPQRTTKLAAPFLISLPKSLKRSMLLQKKIIWRKCQRPSRSLNIQLIKSEFILFYAMYYRIISARALLLFSHHTFETVLTLMLSGLVCFGTVWCNPFFQPSTILGTSQQVWCGGLVVVYYFRDMHNAQFIFIV